MSEQIYVGVDWHKRTSTWVAVNEARQKIYSRSWGCTPEEVQAAISSLPARPEHITLGIEPVCGWRWMTQICMDRGITRTYIANPKRLREIAETAQKTDKNDACTIAELLRMDYLPRAYRASDEVHALRMLVRQRGFFVRLGIATKCRIHGVCTALGAHVTTEQPLLQTGRRAIAEGTNEELKDLYSTMDEIETHRVRLEKKITNTIKETGTYRILTSVPGVGPVTASAILAEVGDFKRFASPSALISYAGIYPRERSSAGKQRFGGISKIGSKLLRYTIIEASMRIRDTEASHNLYSHYDCARNKRNKTPKQARVVLAHKMLTIMWHLVHRGVIYDDRAVQSAQREMTS
jgi:transposase